jgi:hypothetical protein
MTHRIALTAFFLWLSAWMGALGGPPATAPATAPTTAPVDPRWRDAPNTYTVHKPAEYKTLDAWQARRAWLREQIRVATGLWLEPERTPLSANIFDRREYDGYSIEKVYFESRPGFYVIGNLYRPAQIEGRIPGVACALGHWKHGRLQQDQTGNHPALALTLAKLGATVFVYDMTGCNEGARQLEHGINTPALDLWGLTSLHLQTWNSMRVLDFLQSLPEVDPERIGMTGASGGATQTFILYSLDDRVKVAAPVNMISSSMQGGCICENAPGLRIGTNNMEIGALMAPRPLLMVSASGDWTTLTPQVEYPFIRSIYELYGQADKVQNVHIEAEHNYNQASRQAMYRFFAKWLLKRDDADTITEGQTPQFKPEELLVWTEETAPKDLLTFDKLALQLQAEADQRIAALAPETPEKLQELTAVVRTSLAHILAAPFPKAEDVALTRDDTSGRVSMHYERNGLRVDGEVRAAGQEPTRLILRSAWPVASSPPQPPPVLPAGWELVSFTPFAPRGHTQPITKDKPADVPEFFSTFNRLDAAESASDVLTVLAAELLHGGSEQVTLAGFGEMGPVCLVARALVPRTLVESRGLRTVIDMNGFDADSDEAYLKELNLPHIRRIGGLRAVAAVACNGPIWFHNVGEHFDEQWVKAAGKVNGVEVCVTRERADERAVVEWLTK